MKKLLLMRHAKSSWSDADQKDEERPLNERGRAAAATMAEWLAGRGDIPDIVITSSARRSQETWERMRKVLGTKRTKVIVEDNLYSSGPSAMLKALRKAPKGANTVLMIGHQPVVSSFARKLANSTTKSSCARAYKKFPTAAIAVFEPNSDTWAEIDFADADFKRFACPKELVDA